MARPKADTEPQGDPDTVVLLPGGALVGLYRAAEAGMETDPETPWATVCEPHGGIVCHATATLARGWLSHPEDWCPECQEGRFPK